MSTLPLYDATMREFDRMFAGTPSPKAPEPLPAAEDDPPALHKLGDDAE